MSNEKFNDDFQSRLLYKNSCETPEGLFVDVAMYAIRWTYPGAISSTTGRLRITTVFSIEDGMIRPEAGLIERWTDKGWLLLEEYIESYASFDDPTHFQDVLVAHAHAFIMGIPLNVVDPDWDDYPPLSTGKPKPKNAGNLKVVHDADKKKNEPKKEDKSDPFTFVSHKDVINKNKKDKDETVLEKLKTLVKTKESEINTYEMPEDTSDDEDSDDGDDLDWV